MTWPGSFDPLAWSDVGGKNGAIMGVGLLVPMGPFDNGPENSKMVGETMSTLYIYKLYIYCK